ncbi:MAG: hypothetical protein KBF88_01120 [Polyangiaceae bacterium]|nr:hypothetical protein [Polyangiaceae bacterium]
MKNVLGLVMLGLLQFGCAEALEPEDTGLAQKTPVGGSGVASTFSEGEDIDPTRMVPVAPIRPADAPLVESYRDYAAFTYKNRVGTEVIGQSLLSYDGNGVWTRYCGMSQAANGPDWATCSAWDKGVQVSDWGLKRIAPLTGISSYVVGAKDGQWLIQTAIGNNGRSQMGRSCPIGDHAPLYSQCSDWEKYAIEINKLDLGLESVRDELSYSYFDENGDAWLWQTYVSSEGNYYVDRHCNDNAGFPSDSANCEIGRGNVSSNTFGFGTLSGHGGYSYTSNSGKNVFVSTVIDASGKRAAKRACEITSRGIDEGSCESWQSFSIENVRGKAWEL